MATSTSFPLSFLLLFTFTVTVDITYSQITVADNIFDALDKLGCSQFKAFITAANLQERYKYGSPATIFVFTDITYGNILPSRRGNLYEQTERGAKNYVESFTLSQTLETSSFSSASRYLSEFSNSGYLFLNRRQLLKGNVASGRAGATRYYVNGAAIVSPDIKAGQQIIHIIDRVLDMPLQANALSYADSFNPKKTQYKFYTDLMVPLSRSLNYDSNINYSNQVRRVLMGDQVTFFMPTDQAMNEVPSQKLQELIGNPQKLLEIVTLHIVPSKVLYTSLVNHNEGFVSQHNSGRVIFRKNFDKEAVYVSGALAGGGTVTARILPTRANITVRNGVVHQIDQLLGFVYRSALEEIQSKSQQGTNSFQAIVNSASKTLQNYLSATSGVTVFVPTDNAMIAISNVYENYQRNTSLINRVLALSLLDEGTPFSLTKNNRGYTSMFLLTSRYNGRKIKVYSEGNDTWVEGGYVRARVIKPDIGVTNGFVQIIDAVFGIPTRDIVYTIFCNDWLIRTYEAMVSVQLNEYMRDPNLVKNQQCSFRSGESGSPAGDINTYTDSEQLCGDGYYRCRFTYFVPNGTAIESFQASPAGRSIMMNEPRRFRWLLRRLMTRRKTIYLDQLAHGAPYRYIADNGEEVRIQVTGRMNTNTYSSAYIMFDNVRADILRSDIGATNGVIHIIDKIIFVEDDLHRDISAASFHLLSSITLFSLTLVSVFLAKC